MAAAFFALGAAFAGQWHAEKVHVPTAAPHGKNPQPTRPPRATGTRQEYAPAYVLVLHAFVSVRMRTCMHYELAIHVIKQCTCV